MRNSERARPLSKSSICVGVCLLLLSAACDSLLEVDTPTRLPADAIDNPAMAQTFALSAIADFECAYTNYIGGTGLLTDELQNSTGWIAPRLWDQRNLGPTDVGTTSCTATGYGNWGVIHTARMQAEDAYERIAGWTSEGAVADGEELMGQMAAYAGYNLILLGEGFCEVTVDGGPLLTRDEVMELARERFTSALAHAQASGRADIANMALVGRARASLNLGELTAAAEDAQAVPEGFEVQATYSTATQRRENRQYRDNHAERWVSVDPTFRDLEIDGVADPRVPVQDAGVIAQDGLTDLWVQLKYDSRSASIPIASWEEAQLIIAEADGGQEAITAINRLREASDLPEVPSDYAGDVLDLVLEERRRELFLQGHRINDMIRHDRLEFPSGSTHKGVPRGNTTCLPLPEVERANNPNLS